MSIDPLPPVLGTPYTHNPYEYAGNNPLALLDPLGLRALTDQEFITMATAYNKNVNESHSGDWEYLAGGILIAVAAVAAIATAPLSLSLGMAALVGMGISAVSAAGFSMVNQKATKGRVDADEVLVDTVIGGIFGLVTGGASSFIKPATSLGIYASNIGLNVADNVGGKCNCRMDKTFSRWKRFIRLSLYL